MTTDGLNGGPTGQAAREERRNARAGEVTDASTNAFTAQCYEGEDPPPLGSLVTTVDGEVEIFGVVFHAATTGLDRSRPVMALGEDSETEDDLHARHPQLTQLLRTEFSAIVVGHRVAGAIAYVLPPRPARLHGFVHVAELETLRAFTRSLHFIANLVGAPVTAADHATAAFVRQALYAQDDPAEFQLAAGKELARLLARDVQRLNTLLRMFHA